MRSFSTSREKGFPLSGLNAFFRAAPRLSEDDKKAFPKEMEDLRALSEDIPFKGDELKVKLFFLTSLTSLYPITI